MRETFTVPEDDEFMTIREHDAANFRYSALLSWRRPERRSRADPITANNTRSVEQKKALFQQIAELLGENPGMRPEDVFVSLVEVAKENWSLCHSLGQ